MCKYVNTLSVSTASEPYCAVSMQPQVENTGNVDLSEVGVVHPRIASDCPTAVTTLGPGDNFQCEGTYALSWVDIASGVLDIPAK